MSLPLLTIVFPDGTTEYRTDPRALAAGDVVRHLGEDLVVVTVGADHTGSTILTLRRSDQGPEILL
jgi:hypothetical protein